jgi:hypothetical protein
MSKYRSAWDEVRALAQSLIPDPGAHVPAYEVDEGAREAGGEWYCACGTKNAGSGGAYMPCTSAEQPDRDDPEVVASEILHLLPRLDDKRTGGGRLRVFVRPENGAKDRIGPVLGPFEYVQMTYDTCRVEDDREIGQYLHGMWHVDGLEGEWSDVVIYTKEEAEVGE